MHTHNSGKPPVNDGSVIRAVLPAGGNGPKRLARLMSVPVETARCWYYRHLSSSRRREVAAALLAEMDKQDVERSALRRRLAEWASGD